MSLDIEINSKQYSLVPGGDGTKVSTRPVQQFVQSIKDTGRTRPEDVSPYETFIHPDLTGGFGRYRINSDKAFDPSEYRRFWDSTLDTRWQDAVYLPILAEDAAQPISKTDSTELDVLKASTSIAGELYGLWSGPGNTIHTAKFTGAFTTLAEALDDSETGIDVDDASNLEVDDVITIDSEKMLITAISTNTLTVERDVLGTTAAIHSDEAAVTTDRWQPNQTRLWPRVVVGGSHSTPSTGYNFNINIPAGTDLFVMCLLGFDAGTLIDDVNSITIGGAAMSAGIANNQGTYNWCSMHYKTNPSTGSSVAFAAEWNVQGDTSTIDEPSFLHFSIQGAAAAGYTDSDNSDLSSTTTLSNQLTTAIGDICIRAFAVPDDVTITTGDDQISAGTFSASNFTHNASYQIATVAGTHAVTMGGSISEAESGPSGALAFAKGNPVVPVDMTSSGGNLVSLIVYEDDHLVFTGTSAATTQPTAGMLASNVTDGKNVDAGLFATIGGELVLAVHQGTNITFFSSTNHGTTWADESIDIPSGNGPQGVAVYPGLDGEDKLYVAAHEGIYEVDTAPSTWTYSLAVPLSNHNDNGRRMTVHSGSLWFGQGVDNDTAAPIYRMTVSGSSRSIETGYGLDVGDGVPVDMLGSVTYMKSSGDQLFIAVGGGAANKKARILSWSNGGWHHMYRNTTANQKIDWIDVSSGDDQVPRLHFSERISATESNVKYLAQPLVNPRSGVSIKRMDDSSGVTGYVDLPYIDLGMPHENKNFLRAHVNGEDLNSSAANEYITVQYGTDDDARTTTSLGNYTSATTVNSFQSNAGESAKNIGMRVNFLRGSTNTATPKLKDLIVEGAIVPGILYEHQMTIDLEQTAEDTGQSIETVISNIESLVESVIQTQFKFGSVSKYVTLDRERSGFSFGINSWDAGGAPNALAERTGTFNCVLVEKVAS